MRLVQPTPFAPDTPVTHPLTLRGPRGERLRLSVLEQDVIRVQHCPNGRPRLDRTWLVVDQSGDVPLHGRNRDDLTPFSCPAYEREIIPTAIVLKTHELQLTISPEEGALQWATADGTPFAADLRGRSYAYDRAGMAVYHYMARRPDEHYYGFGERSGALDKRGRRLRLYNLDAFGYNAETSDPLYKHIPFYITFIPSLDLAYGLFYDNLATTIFDLGCEIDNYYPAYRYYQAAGGDIDYYLLYGPSIEAVIEKLTALTGRMALPPRWSLGYLGSTMAYTEAADAQAQLAHFIELCQQHRIPCDLFHLSSGYTSGAAGRRYVFNWNRQRIPQPEEMLGRFRAAGMHVAANIKPALLTSHPRYDEVRALGGFIQASESDQPHQQPFWGGQAAHIDFTNPRAYAWWQQNVTEQLLALGVTSTWNDNNEYSLEDDEARCAGFGRPLPLGLVRPLHTLLMCRASYEAQRAFAPDQRPYLITRAGCPGIQRYAQTWSGDNHTSWHTLRYNIPMGLGLSLSGIPNTGHDVGGFAGPKPDPELFVRWVQCGIFFPRFSIHSWNSDRSANEPWMYPKVLDIVRQAIEFRYRLIPYLYTLLFEAAQTGHPLMRPMVYACPHDPHCHTESFDFMLGPNLLVAPVYEPNVRTRAVYLPQGRDWCDFYTGQWHTGGQTIVAEAPLERLPLFVPAGGVVPLGKAMRYVGEQADDVRQCHLFPHPDGGEATFRLIEDDGWSLAYQTGGYCEIKLRVASNKKQIKVETQRQGDYELSYRQLELVLPSGDQRPLVVDRPVIQRWQDDHLRQHLLIDMERDNDT